MTSYLVRFCCTGIGTLAYAQKVMAVGAPTPSIHMSNKGGHGFGLVRGVCVLVAPPLPAPGWRPAVRAVLPLRRVHARGHASPQRTARAVLNRANGWLVGVPVVPRTSDMAGDLRLAKTGAALSSGPWLRVRAARAACRCLAAPVPGGGSRAVLFCCRRRRGRISRMSARRTIARRHGWPKGSPTTKQMLSQNCL